MAVKDYNNKNSAAYLDVSKYWDGKSLRPYDAWPNSGRFYFESSKKLQDKLPQFITDYPVFLRGPPSGNLIPQLTEQTNPYYSILIGRLLNRPTFVVTVNYPGTKDPSMIFTHDEPYVLTNDGIFFGYWLDKEAFLKEYEGKANTPRLEGKYRPFELR